MSYDDSFAPQPAIMTGPTPSGVRSRRMLCSPSGSSPGGPACDRGSLVDGLVSSGKLLMLVSCWACERRRWSKRRRRSPAGSSSCGTPSHIHVPPGTRLHKSSGPTRLARSRSSAWSLCAVEDLQFQQQADIRALVGRRMGKSPETLRHGPGIVGGEQQVVPKDLPPRTAGSTAVVGDTGKQPVDSAMFRRPIGFQGQTVPVVANTGAIVRLGQSHGARAQPARGTLTRSSNCPPRCSTT